MPESIESSKFVSHRQRMSRGFDLREDSQLIDFHDGDFFLKIVILNQKISPSIKKNVSPSYTH